MSVMAASDDCVWAQTRWSPVLTGLLGVGVRLPLNQNRTRRIRLPRPRASVCLCQSLSSRGVADPVQLVRLEVRRAWGQRGVPEAVPHRLLRDGLAVEDPDGSASRQCLLESRKGRVTECLVWHVRVPGIGSHGAGHVQQRIVGSGHGWTPSSRSRSTPSVAVLDGAAWPAFGWRNVGHLPPSRRSGRGR